MSQTPTITRILLGATSAYLVRGPVPILVDAGTASQKGLLLSQLRRLGVEPADLALVIVTHAHSDHAGGLAQLRASTDAAIACSPETMVCLERGASARLRPRATALRLLLPLLSRMAAYPPVHGDVAIPEAMTLAPYGIDGVILPTPGHTRGCLSVLVGEDIIAGDLVSGRLGRPQIASMPTFVEDRVAWEESVRLVLLKGAQRFHVAHGGPFDAERVAALL